MSSESAFELAIRNKEKEKGRKMEGTNTVLYRKTISSEAPIMITDKVWGMQREKKTTPI